MTLSRARDPFAGINHWKRKHIPAATQICQHPTAARARARAGARVRNGTFTRGARMTEMIPVERERARVNKREIMTRPRPTFARTRPRGVCTHVHVHMLARVRLTESGSPARGIQRRRDGERGRDARRAENQRGSERKPACGTEVARESGPEARCSSVDDSSLPWGARAAQPYSVHARVHADARVCGASRHQRGAIRSVCPCPLGDLEMCVMKYARIIAGHSFDT